MVHKKARRIEYHHQGLTAAVCQLLFDKPVDAENNQHAVNFLFAWNIARKRGKYRQRIIERYGGHSPNWPFGPSPARSGTKLVVLWILLIVTCPSRSTPRQCHFSDDPLTTIRNRNSPILWRTTRFDNWAEKDSEIVVEWSDLSSGNH